MLLNEKQRSSAFSMAKLFIDNECSHGKKLEYDHISSYINQVLSLLRFEADEDDIAHLFSEIEYNYRITHTQGQCIFDNYDDIRDWYKNDSELNGYWSRYRQYLIDNTNIDTKSIDILDEETLPNIMNCLGNPNDVFDGTRLRRGLIIGDVQSGKTATYSGLICKAADAGYKVVILLAGITESLRRQTQERIDEGIVGYTAKKVLKKVIKEHVGVGSSGKTINATSFTSCVKDFVSETDKIATSLSSQNALVLFVIKKNVSVLQKLHDWLKEMNLDPIKGYVDVPMLLIDDEADNASVNTKKEDCDPTKTNKLIRSICSLFKNATYVGFTATPFANVFIDPDSEDSMKRADLFPEHFIYALPTPSNYIGANRIFYQEGDCYQNLRYITDIVEPDYLSDEYIYAVQNEIDSLNSGPFYYRHKKEWNGIYPASLREAVISFFLANAIRDLRGNHSAPRSMLVNMSRFVKVQYLIADYLEELHQSVFDTVRFDFNEDITKNSNLPLFIEFNNIWQKHYSHVKDVNVDRVLQKQTLLTAMEKIKVIVVNSSKDSGTLDYRSNPSLRVIAVGGLALSRGLTLEGLLTSYFYRNTATFDVLMQMGRWFGYRHGYEDIFQIWTTAVSAKWYAEIARSSEELKNDIKTMFEQQLTPKDFGLKVRDNCDELQITASNKMRNSFNLDLQFSFYGRFIETPYISLNTKQNKRNLDAVKKFSNILFSDKFKLRFAEIGKYDDKDINNINGASRFFEKVPKSLIIDFLSSIKCSLVNMFFNIGNILEFIKDDSNVGLDYWNVIFVGGESKSYYDIPGLETIQCADRAIFSNNRAIQITSRRRLLSANAGKLSLSSIEIKDAEVAQRNQWITAGCTPEEASRRSIPMSAYFSFLKNRLPVIYIVLVSPRPADSPEPNDITRFREELGDEKIVAFGIGCPAVEDGGKSCHFKANKTYYRINMLDNTNNEEDEE